MQQIRSMWKTLLSALASDKAIPVVVGITFLVLMFVSPSPVIAGTSVVGVDAFNTGAFDCTPEERPLTEWVNTIGDIRIYNAKIWFGANGGAVADVGAIVYRKSDKSVLFHENWDRYADPTTLHIDTLDLAPNYMELKKGDKLGMAYWCHPFNERAKKGHVIVTIWYSK